MIEVVRFSDVIMNNGSEFSAEKQEELVKHIINKFSEESLSHAEAGIVLEKVSSCIGDCSKIQAVN